MPVPCSNAREVVLCALMQVSEEPGGWRRTAKVAPVFAAFVKGDKPSESEVDLENPPGFQTALKVLRNKMQIIHNEASGLARITSLGHAAAKGFELPPELSALLVNA